MHQDRRSNVLAVGDTVVFTEHETSQLFFAIVEGFTPKKVKIRQFREGSTYQYSPSVKDPDRLLKVEPFNA